MIKKRNDSVINKTGVDLTEFIKREVEFLQADMKFKHKVVKEYEFAENLIEEVENERNQEHFRVVRHG